MGKAINELDNSGSITDATLVPVGETDTLKKTTWATIKATLKTYFDSLYLSVTGGTITDTTRAVGGASAGSALTVNQTWNTTGTPTAIKLNVTDTASNAASRLMDLQVGGITRASVSKTGQATANGVTFLDPAIVDKTHSYPAIYETNTGSPLVTDLTVNAGGGRLFFTNAFEISFGVPTGGMTGFANVLSLGTSGNSRLNFNGGPNIQGGSGDSLYLNSYWGTKVQGTNSAYSTVALTVIGDPTVTTASLQEWNTGGTAKAAITKTGEFRVFNLNTDASNYERGVSAWSSNVWYHKTEAAGTGTRRLYVPVTNPTTVASLPAASTAGAGARSMVTDATATTFLSVVAGGGSNAVPVISDGTNWLIG